MPQFNQRKFPKSYDSIASIHEFLGAFCACVNLSEQAFNTLELSAEEIFTNMVKYAPESNSDIEITLTNQTKYIEMRLIDFDVNRFDVTQAPLVNPNRPPQSVKPGGLGIHLIRNLAAEFRYDYVDGNSCVTVVVECESGNCSKS